MSLFTQWLMGHDQIVLQEKQRATHTYVIGQPGMGKSRALESWIMQDILAGRGVGVIDPHGDMFNNLLARVAKLPELWAKVILVDPADPSWSVAFNPLEALDRTSLERVALLTTDICVKIWKLEPASAPRMVWLLTNTFLALSSLGLTLLDLPRFLTDREYREEQLVQIPLPSVRGYFEYEFPQTETGARQWITPVLNKLGALLFDPDISLMFSGKSTINFRTIMDNRMILLINLSKGFLSEGLSALVAAFIVAHLQKAALSRADTLHRPAFYLYLDEFQNYTTDNITDILSESRKYVLSLTLAHQYLDQLAPDLRSAVLNTAGNLVSFRLGYQDARTLAKEIFPAPDFFRTVEPRMHLRQRGMLVLPHLQNVGWEGLALELTSLPARQFWMRKRGPHEPVKQLSFWMPAPHITSGLAKQIQDLRDFSGSRYARRKNANQQEATPSAQQDDLPFWAA
jgi:hypothetical protein